LILRKEQSGLFEDILSAHDEWFCPRL